GDLILTNVTLMASADAGARQLALFGSASGPDCFAYTIKDEAAAPKGASFGAVKGVAVPIEQIGDGAVHYRVTLAITRANGRQFRVTEDAQIVQSGRAIIAAFYLTLSGRPFDAVLARQLTQKMVDRAPAV